MGLRCLSCRKDTPEDKLSVKNEVLVCESCADNVDGFLRALMADLRLIDSLSAITIRKALLVGQFRESWTFTTPLDKLGLLIRFMQETKPCSSNSTQPSPQLTQPSGEPLPPHVSTLTALAAAGRKPSNSPTE